MCNICKTKKVIAKIPFEYYSNIDNLIKYLYNLYNNYVNENQYASDNDKKEYEKLIIRTALNDISKTELKPEDRMIYTQKIVKFKKIYEDIVYPKEIELEEVDIISYYDKENNILGCSHYQRKCYIFAECCKKYYPCRLCHNKSENHEVDRSTIKTKISNECENCHTKFANYYCDICHLFDDDINKKIYHCEKCGICRVGDKKDFFHCDKCCGCFKTKNHICIENNVHSSCPICFEELFNSTEPSCSLKCGHLIHKECLNLYLIEHYTCPICSKSIYKATDYFKLIDESLAKEVLPIEYHGLYNEILCNDCEQKSIAKFHFLYHKCYYCKGYNTVVVRNIPKEENSKIPEIRELESLGRETCAMN